jgi:sulfide dehydrogenase cytochrome subunit
MGLQKQLVPLLAGLAALAGAGQLQAEPSAAMLANTCAGCHGYEGKSVGPASPNLAGMSETYFIESMEAFKFGDRPSTIMGRIATGYTDEQTAAMAAYFASLPVYKAPQEVDAAMAEEGAKIFEKGCENCHSEGGSVPDDDAGILAGQWLPYMQYTMEDYLAGHREMTKKMKKQVEKLDAEQLQAVLHYLASQK